MSKVQWVEVSDQEAGQRLDNFLMRHLRKAPKALVYRIIRKGEVRVNKGRAQASTRLQENDVVRIPPVRLPEADEQVAPPKLQMDRIEDLIVYEDADLIVVNKPSGIAVHGGSGVSWGLIELVRQLRPLAKRIELVHRLDRDTSGLIILAKKTSVLRNLHQQIRDDQVKKVYWALVAGVWPRNKTKVDLPLLKNTLRSGERMVEVSPEGKPSLSYFKVQKQFAEATWVEVTLVTGRTHQIRVHAQASGCPIVGDPKYGHDEVNRHFKGLGMKRLALHAYQLEFTHPVSGAQLSLQAPLFQDFENLLQSLSKG